MSNIQTGPSTKVHTNCEGHDHSHSHDHANDHHDDGHDHHEHEPNKNSGLSMAFWLNFFFSAIEVAGGIFTNSTAIIADAFHDFMDAAAIGIAILLEKVSGKKRTAGFSYGYKRFSLLSALGLSTFLLAGAVVMIVGAYKSFLTPKEVNSVGMLWLAVLGLAVNGFAFYRIKNGGDSAHAHHGHSHAGHNHGGHNHNSQSIMLHLLEDVLGWAAVLVGAAVIYFTGWYWIDGLLAIGIALFIGYNASKNLISTIKVLLQSVPEGIDIPELTDGLTKIQGVASIHDLHVWSLDGNYNVASVHAVIDGHPAATEQQIRKQILSVMNQYQIQHPTVQVETASENCALASC